MTALFDIDPLTGAHSRTSFDHRSGELVFTKKQNVDALLDANQAVYNDSSERWRGKDNDFWHVASIDLVTLMDWLTEFNRPRPDDLKLMSPFYSDDEWSKFMDAKLNSSDFRKFRTAPVRV